MEKSLISQVVTFLDEINNPKPRNVYCPHCEKEGLKSLCTYRGSMIIEDVDYKQLIKLCEDSPELKNIAKYQIEEGITNRDSSSGSVYHKTYVACDKCIESEHEGILAYFPDGWKEKVFKVRHYGPYAEPLRLNRGN